MPRGIDPDRIGERRNQRDSDAFVVPRPRVTDDEDDAPPMERPRIVPGERSQQGNGGWPSYERLRARDMVPMGLDEEEVLHTGKHTRRAPVVREAEDEPWWVGRLNEIVPAVTSIVLIFVLAALVFILLFKPEWFDMLGNAIDWLSKLDGT